MASDFGCCVNVYYSDGSDAGLCDEAPIVIGARTVGDVGRRWIDYGKDELLARIDCTSPAGQKGVSVRLTSYLADDLPEGESEESLIAQDAIRAEQFAAELSAYLGADYRVESYSGRW